MRSKRIISGLLAAALVMTALTACGGEKGNNGESSSAISSRSESSSAVQSESSASGAATSVAGVSSAVSSQVLSQPAESQNGPVLTVKTDDKEFDKKFAENPIDKAYVKESATAISNVDMVNVSEKYSGIWQKEIDGAYKALTKAMSTDSSQKPKQLKAEQEKWESGKTAALQKISAEAQAAGGTMAQVDAASKTMNYYRDRAAKLYRQLYSYDKNYIYAYQAK